MSNFDEYRDRFDCLTMERRDGILSATMHTKGDSLQWGQAPQAELAEAFDCMARDAGNRVIILSGTGADFIGPRQNPAGTAFTRGRNTSPAKIHALHHNARRLMTCLLDIEVPMIGVINGPAKRHADLGLMCDIVIAAPDATIEDTAHLPLGGLVPGDGINVVLTVLLGLNRARYLMLTGQVLTAQEALRLGLVAELHERGDLAARAQTLAVALAAKPDMLLRATRRVLTRPMRDAMTRGLDYSLALEAQAMLEATD